MIETLFYVGVAVVTERAMTDPTNDGAIAGGIVAASLAVTLVLVLIIIFLCRRYAHADLTHLIIIPKSCNSRTNIENWLSYSIGAMCNINYPFYTQGQRFPDPRLRHHSLRG